MTEREHRPVAFFHGVSTLEGVTRTAIGTLEKVAPRAVRSTAIFSSDNHFVSGLRNVGIAVDTLEFLPHTLDRNFQIHQYTHAIDTMMSDLARRHRLDVVVADSVGTLATLEAIVIRLDRHEPIPRLLVLVDPLLGGLTDLAQWYLRASHQTTRAHPRRGLMELLPDSDYLVGLRNALVYVQDELPSTIVFQGQTTPTHFSLPFISLPKKYLEPLFDRLHIDLSSDNDGMGRKGPEEEIWPEGKITRIPIVGATHTNTLKRATPFIQEIVEQNTLCGFPL